jgi:chromate transporter
MTEPTGQTQGERLKEVALVFLKLGTTAFGGPPAHIAMMDEEIVRRRKWVSQETFLDLLGASNIIPGPNSTELAIHLGYKRAGWAGLITAGACFIVPAMLLVGIFAYLYATFQTMPQLQSVLYGVKPVIIAVVAQALWGLRKTAMKTKTTLIVGLLALVLAIAGMNELFLLLLCGAAVMMMERLKDKGAADRRRMNSFFPGALLLGSSAAPVALGSMSTAGLFWSFLKIGSVLYGSGYVLLAFLQSEFVDRYQVLTAQQLIDAVAVGQFTPGPLFTTATFVGYLIHGAPGAVWATLGIFLPAFVFVALTMKWIPKLRQSKPLSAFLDGVNVASIALMAAVSWQLGVASVTDPITAVIAIVSLLVLLRYRMNSAWLVLAGGLLGWLLQTAGLAL